MFFIVKSERYEIFLIEFLKTHYLKSLQLFLAHFIKQDLDVGGFLF